MLNQAIGTLVKGVAIFVCSFALSANAAQDTSAQPASNPAEVKTTIQAEQKVANLVVSDVKATYNKEHKNMAVHFTLKNNGDKVNLINISAEPANIAKKVELHDSKMHVAEKVEVNKGDTKFDEKTHHVMLIDLSAENAAKGFALTLKFDNNTNVKVDVPAVK